MMKGRNSKKKGIKSLALLLALILTIGFSPVTNVEAKAAPRLNYRKVTLVQGKKKRLKVKNLKKGRKVKWYSTKKSVATVNKKGIVKAKKKGKAYIVAKVGKKKYRCKVIVKKKVSKKKSKKKSSKKTATKKPIGSVKKQLPGDCIAKWSVLDQPTLAVNNKTNLFNYLTYHGKKINVTSNSVKVKYYKWLSSDTSKLVIDKYGVATGKKSGTVKITCRYMLRSGEWWSTISTVSVVETNKINVSYSTNFDSTLSKDAHYATYLLNDTANRFNVMNLTLTNNSDKDIILNDYLTFGLSCTDNSYSFITEDNKTVVVRAHSSKTVKYVPGFYYGFFDERCSYNFMLNKKELDSLHFSFKTNDKKVFASYYVSSKKLILN